MTMLSLPILSSICLLPPPPPAGGVYPYYILLSVLPPQTAVQIDVEVQGLDISNLPPAVIHLNPVTYDIIISSGKLLVETS